MTKITVLTGGSNAERDVAIAGAAQVVRALRKSHDDVRVVDTVDGPIAPSDETRYLASRVDAQPPSLADVTSLASRELGPKLVELPEIAAGDLVFLVLHGNQGEGGDMQALLEDHGIIYTGSGPAGSRLAMDKSAAKSRFNTAAIPTADWVMWPVLESDVAYLGLPLIVKPSKVGSTLGLSVVDSVAQLKNAVDFALSYDDEVMIERFVPGREFTVGVLGDRALAVGEILPQHDIFDYECKYTPGMSEETFPAAIDDDLARKLRKLALQAHEALELRDFSRVDFRLDEAGIPQCLEANTLPGLTSTSLLPQSAAAQGISFAELCETICALALQRTGSRNKVGTK